MVHFDVGPSETVIRSLLQVKRVEFIGLCRGAGHQSIKYRGVIFDARTENTKKSKLHEKLDAVPFERMHLECKKKRKLETFYKRMAMVTVVNLTLSTT